MISWQDPNKPKLIVPDWYHPFEPHVMAINKKPIKATTIAIILVTFILVVVCDLVICLFRSKIDLLLKNIYIKKL